MDLTYDSNVFVVKYNADESVVWAESAANAYGQDIARSINGDIIVTGSFNDTSAFGPTELSSAGRDDIFIWNVCKVSSTNIKEDLIFCFKLQNISKSYQQ